jgi:serine/threonine protein kinase
MALQTGKVLNNRYRIVKLLGQGGFGAVYRAWDSNLNRACAVKENMDTSPEAQRQFTREATVLANLSHPNLPRVTDHFILPSQGQYLVMDYVEGDDLAGVLRQRGPIPVQQAVIWISQVADALIYLHSRQPPVVHRDIKPANIKITPEGKAMLVDFGLVKLYNPQMKTTMGARAVTPGYAPPEQYGQGSTDARSDLYALGATLYNILTGQEPLESVQRMSGTQMKPIQMLNTAVPASVGQTIERAMRLEPTQRYQSVAEMKSALQASGEPAVVRPVVETPVIPVSTAPVIRTPISEPNIRQPVSKPPTAKRRTGIWAGGMAVILVCILGAVGVAAWYISDQNKSAQATADAQLQSTLAERVRTTSTAQRKTTSTAKAVATQKVLLTAVTDKSQLVFGPSGGKLEFVSGDSIVAQEAGVNLRDFIVEARFLNPYGQTTGNWDYGFVFRHETKNVQFRFVVRSNKTWVLFNNSGDPNGATIAEGNLTNLNVDEKGTNLIRLVAQGERGWFYLNNALISELDLSARMSAGAVYIASGIFQGDSIAGKSVQYSEYRIWSLP